MKLVCSYILPLFLLRTFCNNDGVWLLLHSGDPPHLFNLKERGLSPLKHIHPDVSIPKTTIKKQMNAYVCERVIGDFLLGVIDKL